MQCFEVRDLIDSFLSEQLLVETNHEILRHLDGCSGCRAAVEAQRELRTVIRGAFLSAEGLQVPAGFRDEASSRLRTAPVRKPRRRFMARRWAVPFGVAAALVIALGLAQFLRLGELDAMARSAVGDHQNCAIAFRLAEKPVSLADSAAHYDASFRLLEHTPPEEWNTAVGPARVLNRHSCVFQGRRFAHIVLEFERQRVSVLITRVDGEPARLINGAIDRPVLVSRPMVDGFRVVSFETPRYMVFVVGSVAEQPLRQLAESISGPLYTLLAGS